MASSDDASSQVAFEEEPIASYESVGTMSFSNSIRISFKKRPKNDDPAQNAVVKRMRSVALSLRPLLNWPRRAETRVVKKSCGICFEDKEPFEFFVGKVCSHRFCSSCIGLHIRSKLQQNLLLVHCPEPNCSENLNPEKCKGIVPYHAIKKWKSALEETKIPFSQRLYCPFQDCSALLLKDVPEDLGSSTMATSVVMEKSECLVCKRFFCVQCSEPWHEGLDCSELKKNESMLFELAKEKEWKQCARCGHIVEKTTGCRSMVCRCGYHFCYGCGSEWRNPCKCPVWTES